MASANTRGIGPHDTISLPAASDLSGNIHYIAEIDGSQEAALAGDSSTKKMGIIKDALANSPYTVELVTSGRFQALAGASMNEGIEITSGASGTAVAATTGKRIVGVTAHQVDSGSLVEIILDPACGYKA